jgi:galactose-1-phosphate uridylyltransferase
MATRQTHLVFDSKIGGTKPVTVVDVGHKCPFCNRDELTGVIAADGPILLIANKYPVLRDTYQTVIIETEDCTAELSLYPKEHLHRVIRFGIKKWLDMIAGGEFASVLLFKNHGPSSGGTICHPHMQIVGLRNIDYTDNIPPTSLEGSVISTDCGVILSIADKPLIGFVEFNVKLADLGQIDRMADYLQICTHYLLNHFNRYCNSYNIFFYHIDGQITAKIMPRFVTSPIFVGYAIPQLSTRIPDIVADLRRIYGL